MITNQIIVEGIEAFKEMSTQRGQEEVIETVSKQLTRLEARAFYGQCLDYIIDERAAFFKLNFLLLVKAMIIC